MKLMPGDQILYEVSYLEMRKPPNFDWPKKPTEDINVLNSLRPSSDYFFNLYASVGSEYEWTDKYEVPVHEVEEFLSDQSVRMFTFFKDCRTAGFFILDGRRHAICDLTYFGLLPDFIGYGYGEYLLRFAVKEGWKAGDIKTLTVNTNSLDHPNALPLYKKIGFKVTNCEKETRTLTRSRIINDNSC